MARALLIGSLALVASSGGCSKDDPSPIDGAWSADLPGQVLLFVNLSANGTVVTGTGRYSSLVTAQPITLHITGQWVDPGLTITLGGWPGGAATFVAQLTDQGMLSGTITSGSVSQSLTLRRG